MNTTTTSRIPIGTRVRNQDLPPDHPSGKTGTMTGTVIGHDGIFHIVKADNGQVWDSELAGDLTIEPSALTDADRATVGAYLRDHGYEDLAAWGRDSDYLLTETDGWVDLDDNTVDLEVQCFHAIEAAGEAQDEQRYVP